MAEFDPPNPGLHFPYLDEVISDEDGNYHEQNYLALERFSARLCKGLHVPYKQWLRVDPTYPHGPQWEEANLLAVERWANGIGRCCVEPAPTPTVFVPPYDMLQVRATSTILSGYGGGDLGPPSNWDTPVEIQGYDSSPQMDGFARPAANHLSVESVGYFDALVVLTAQWQYPYGFPSQGSLFADLVSGGDDGPFLRLARLGNPTADEATDLTEGVNASAASWLKFFPGTEVRPLFNQTTGDDRLEVVWQMNILLVSSMESHGPGSW